MAQYSAINKKPYEQGLSIFLLLYAVISIAILCLFLYSLWTGTKIREFRLAFRLRYKKHILLSYIIIIPWIIEESIATMYLYWNNTDRSTSEAQQKWTYLKENVPIFYLISADHILHIFFWTALWLFIQLKVLKLRYTICICKPFYFLVLHPYY